MRILITGAAGFLGSHLTKRLLSMGHQIIGLDDFSTGSAENLMGCETDANFTLVHHDVRAPYDFQVDAILNFACPASPKHYQSDPVKTIETNFLGIVHALHLAKKINAIVIQASTSEVYGDPEVSPQSETYWGNVNPIGIRSCYDEGKRAAETLCFDYRRQFNVDARVVRIFNTYGPFMAVGDGRVVSNFVVQALQNNPITLYGNGQQTRSFCFVDDLIDGIVKVLEMSSNANTPINLGNPKEYSMLELAQTVKKLCKSSSEITYLPLPEDDPRQRCPDISVAKQLLSWVPAFTLEEGVLKTIEYFKVVLK
jgi:UDP-glucuronate decarboxylase